MMSRFLPLIAFIIAVLLFFGYAVPAWNGSIAQARAGIATDNVALAAATRYAADQNQLASERDAIDPSGLARLEVMLPDSVDNVQLILDLTALASRVGFSLSKIDVAQDATGGTSIGSQGPVGSVDLSLSAVGSYSALRSFLESVEKSARLLDIRELAVKGSDTGVYSYQMRLRFYWLR